MPKLITKGDYEKALSYTDLTDQEEIQQQIAKFKAFDVKVTDFEVVSEEIAEDGNSATVCVSVTQTSSMDKEPKTKENKLQMVKVDGKWKIHE